MLVLDIEVIPLLTRRGIALILRMFLLVFAFLFLLLPTAHARQQPFTIKVDTQLVIETVVVKDKDGRTIEGLTEKDFTVSEDNVPQTITVFEFQKLDNAAALAPAVAPVSAVRSANQGQISPPRPGTPRASSFRGPYSIIPSSRRSSTTSSSGRSKASRRGFRSKSRISQACAIKPI